MSIVATSADVELLAAGAPLALPGELDPWLVAAVEEALQETDILRQNGFLVGAIARDRLLRQLLAKAEAYFDEEITTAAVAEALECSEETVRRKARDGRLLTSQTSPSGQHKFRRGDLPKVDSSRQKQYDPVADAQDIAKTRRGAA